jgi:divalent metal cation (Fe/Co/Zn/Cd) transporter
MNTHSLTHFAWLSILAAVLTIGLKGGAYLLTGSVGLLSDALESLVNLVAAIAALWALTVASRPMLSMPMATARWNTFRAASRAP